MVWKMFVCACFDGADSPQRPPPPVPHDGVLGAWQKTFRDRTFLLRIVFEYICAADNFFYTNLNSGTSEGSLFLLSSSRSRGVPSSYATAPSAYYRIRKGFRIAQTSLHRFLYWHNGSI